jgi:UDP-3-O-[3-hydroxymyristoyl] glucosamine N-acyltransferase
MERTLSALAEAVGGEAAGDGSFRVAGAAPFETAGPDQITLAGGKAYLKRIGESRAGAFIVPKGVEIPGRNLLAAGNPYAAFARILGLFHPRTPVADRISRRAEIGADFQCGRPVDIAPFVTIGDGVRLGERVRLHPGVVLEDGVTVGDDTELFGQVVVRWGCRIGSRVIVHSGTVIGSDGFGFAPDGEVYVKIPHVGRVEIEDDVEIGALNAIDRATFGRTRIGSGVKTDNLVHVAHNVSVGENSVLVAQVGISGSTTIGRHAVLAGQAGISGHLTLGDNVTVGPQAGVAQSVEDGQVVSGSPEMPHKQWLRVQRTLPRLPEMKRQLADLDRRLRAIEES